MSCGLKNSIIRLRFHTLALAEQPKLAQLITHKIGNNWIKQLEDQSSWKQEADDAEFRNCSAPTG